MMHDDQTGSEAETGPPPPETPPPAVARGRGKSRTQSIDAPRPDPNTRAAHDEVYQADDSDALFALNGELYSRRILSNDREVTRRICNFVPRITAETVTIEDDRIVDRVFEIEIECRDGSTMTLDVPVATFAKEPWWLLAGGSRLAIEAGGQTRQLVNLAAQTLSTTRPLLRTIYKTTGWERIENRWAFLSAAGALAADGMIKNITVELHPDLTAISFRYIHTSDAARSPAVLESTESVINKLAEVLDDAAWVLLAATLRPLIGVNPVPPLFLHSDTSAGKTRTAAVFSLFYGDSHKPDKTISWGSTACAIEDLTHIARHTSRVVDDFAPNSARHVEQLELVADATTRAATSGSGRRRCGVDGRLLPPRSPQCGLVMTGEAIPKMQSLRNRLLVINLPKLDDDQVEGLLQRGSTGTYNAIAACYVQWLAGRLDAERARFTEHREKWRADLRERLGSLNRPAHNAADLAAGLESFLAFLRETGVVSGEVLDNWRELALDAFASIVQGMGELTTERDDTARFLLLIGEAISSGAAHLAANSRGEPPHNSDVARRLGWRPPASGKPDALIGSGPMIGWVDAESAYLFPNAAFKAANALAAGDPIITPIGTLGRRMQERGWLTTFEHDRPTAKRVDATNRRVPVLAVKRERLINLPESSSVQTASDVHAADENEIPFN